jgi:RNA polymerase sigma factor (sigma-70 family)
MEKTKLVKVSLTFVNKKGEQKTVGFEMDEKYFKDLQHPSITAKQREEYMLAEYRMYCKEKKIKRKTQSINSFYKQDGELLIDSGEEKIKTLTYAEEKVNEIFKLLTEDERQIILWLYYDNLTQGEVAKKLNISQPAINKRINKIYDKVRNNFS